MNPKYRFFLQINEGGEKFAANPVYGDDVTLDYELESKQRFYRAKLSGTFKFIRQDYVNIMAAEFDTVYYFYIEKSNDWGQTWTQYYKATFMRTDCTINDDDQVVTVKPNAIDQYNDVLAGLEKEYNLLELAPAIERITITKRPLIQVYKGGESVVSCFLSGLSWEQEANAITSFDELTNKYHFIVGEYIEQYIFEKTDTTKNIPAGMEYRFAGVYGGLVTNAAGYYINGGVFETPGNVIIYSPNDVAVYKQNGNIWEPIDSTFSPLKLSGNAFPIYSRWILDVDVINGLNTFALSADDMVGNNRNYKRVIGNELSGAILISTYLSDEPTEYGKAPSGKYYLPPNTNGLIFPIAKTSWDDYSIWFRQRPSDYNDEINGRKEYELRDSYPISSIISVLLKQFAPDIKHEATPEYSEFLYPANGFNQYGQSFTLFATPKSNLLVGDYQTPTQIAKTTLQQFLDMLRNVFQLYWHIEDNKLRIEHIMWYKKGGTYMGAPVVGYDLTQLQNVRNGKKWEFATSEYSFDKEDMPERYQFAWADEVTQPFNGQPIQIVSKYVQPGKIEEINIGGFTSDIDYMLLNPEAITQEGFALLGAQKNGGKYKLPFFRHDIFTDYLYYQNGYLSMVNLQPTYWLRDMPAKRLIVNGTERQAQGIQRRKSQTITFPVRDNDPDVMELIKTNIGNGEIQKISINLSSRTAKATLKYDTE